MKTEFNLSDCEVNSNNVPINLNKFYPGKDVKKFIRLFKESLRDQHLSDEPDDNLYLSVKKIKGRINRFAGAKLK